MTELLLGSKSGESSAIVNFSALNPNALPLGCTDLESGCLFLLRRVPSMVSEPYLFAYDAHHPIRCCPHHRIPHDSLLWLVLRFASPKACQHLLPPRPLLGDVPVVSSSFCCVVRSPLVWGWGE